MNDSKREIEALNNKLNESNKKLSEAVQTTEQASLKNNEIQDLMVQIKVCVNFSFVIII